MVRMIIGAAVAAVAMLFVGFIFFGIVSATGSVGDVEAASIQQALAAGLPESGTYSIPSPDGSAAQTVMFGQGPIATVHYNSGGFPANDSAMLLVGLVFNFVVALLIGAALIGIDRRVPDFGSRARVAVLVAVAASAFNHLGEPIFWHHDWGHFIYLFVADAISLTLAGLILAWFLPKSRPAASDPPTDV